MKHKVFYCFSKYVVLDASVSPMTNICECEDLETAEKVRDALNSFDENKQDAADIMNLPARNYSELKGREEPPDNDS